MSSVVTVSPATMPSTTATNARPWDSPAVVHRNTCPIFPRPASTGKNPQPPRCGDRRSALSCQTPSASATTPASASAQLPAALSRNQPNDAAAHRIGASRRLDPPKPANRARGVGRIRFRPSSRATPPMRNDRPPARSSARDRFHQCASGPLNAATTPPTKVQKTRSARMDRQRLSSVGRDLVESDVLVIPRWCGETHCPLHHRHCQTLPEPPGYDSTDSPTAATLAAHIDGPCGTVVADQPSRAATAIAAVSSGAPSAARYHTPTPKHPLNAPRPLATWTAPPPTAVGAPRCTSR